LPHQYATEEEYQNRYTQQYFNDYHENFLEEYQVEEFPGQYDQFRENYPVALLISQLPAPHPRVRKNVKTLADITLNDITDFKPLIQDELLKPISLNHCKIFLE